MDEIEIVRNIENAGYAARRRNMHYEILGEPVFRARDVPRMHSLAVARAGEIGGVAADALRYPARSQSGKRLRTDTAN
jgi:hypothetical protein